MRGGGRAERGQIRAWEGLLGPGGPIVLERGNEGMSTATHPGPVQIFTNMFVAYLFVTNMFVTLEE
jgi:hypothetical protein